MSRNNYNFSNTTNDDQKKKATLLVVAFIACFIFPVLFLILPIIVVIYAASKKKNNTYTDNHKTDVHGSGEGVREEILAHEKPIDYSKSTYEIYEELLNKKTDYSGVNKDLL